MSIALTFSSTLQKILVAGFFTLAIFLLLSEQAEAASLDGAAAPARPVFAEACILKAVAGRMGITLKDEIPVPPVHYASETTLEYFQKATKANFGEMVPTMVANMYAFATNEIFLMDEADYYLRTNRKIDDSLAHEFVHFLQVRYQNWDVAHDVNDTAEANAVDVQTWFRDTYISVPGQDPCQAQ